MGFRSVLRSAVVLQVDPGGGSFGHRDDVVVIASVGRDGADRGSAGAVPKVDGVAQFSGGESAEFGDVEEVALLVGDESVEQGAGLLGEGADQVGGDERGPVGELPWGVAVPEQ